MSSSEIRTMRMIDALLVISKADQTEAERMWILIRELPNVRALDLSNAIRDRDAGHESALMFDPYADPNLKAAFSRVVIENARKGVAFQPSRDKGSIGDAMIHILELAKKFPDLTAKELEKKADKEIINGMTFTTFKNKVSFARKQFPKQKKLTK